MDHYELRHHFYNSGDWKKVRTQKITQDPLCERCKENGRITLAQSIHHIKSPFNYKNQTIDIDLALDIDNLLSVCNQCHGEIHEEQRKSSEDLKVSKNKMTFGGFMSKKRKL